MDNNEIRIKVSRTKIIILTMGSGIFIALAVWLWRVSYVYYGVSFIAIIFFGMCGLYGSFKIFSSRPGLILSAEGITDNTSAAGMIKIFWNDVIKLETVEIQRNRFILVFVKNPSGIIHNGNFFKRLLKWLTHKQFGTPVCISSLSLKCNFEYLSDLISGYYRKYNPVAEISPGAGVGSSISSFYRVHWDNKKIYRSSSFPGQYHWSDNLEWDKITRICFEANDFTESDNIYIFTGEREESYLIPVDAEGGSDLWNEIIKRGLFDAQLAIRAASSTGGLFVWPEDY